MDELNRPVRHKFRKRKVYVNHIKEIWAADLIDVNNMSKFNKLTMQKAYMCIGGHQGPVS